VKVSIFNSLALIIPIYSLNLFLQVQFSVRNLLSAFAKSKYFALLPLTPPAFL